VDVCPYAGIVTDEKAERVPREHIVAQNRLQLAYLIRVIKDTSGVYFIVEDVATRRRQRFESIEALLARLETLFSN
jgi:hypothetical protein